MFYLGLHPLKNLQTSHTFLLNDKNTLNCQDIIIILVFLYSLQQALASGGFPIAVPLAANAFPDNQANTSMNG